MGARTSASIKNKQRKKSGRGGRQKKKKFPSLTHKKVMRERIDKKKKVKKRKT